MIAEADEPSGSVMAGGRQEPADGRAQLGPGPCALDGNGECSAGWVSGSGPLDVAACELDVDVGG